MDFFETRPFVPPVCHPIGPGLKLKTSLRAGRADGPSDGSNHGLKLKTSVRAGRANDPSGGQNHGLRLVARLSG